MLNHRHLLEGSLIRHLPAIVAATIAAFPAHPALAQGTAIPEPTGTTLFGLGVAGLVIGRYAAKRKPRD